MNLIPRLSKSRLISGWQCPKRLWLEIHKPGELEFTSATENAFAIGHKVGEAAQSQFPEGILVKHEGRVITTDYLLSKMLPGTLATASQKLLDESVTYGKPWPDQSLI